MIEQPQDDEEQLEESEELFEENENEDQEDEQYSNIIQPMGQPIHGYRGGMGAEYPQDIGTTMTDNDFINLLRDVTDPNLRKQLDHYLRYNPLTPAAVHKLKTYYRGVLNMGLVASNIKRTHDFERLMDRYLIIKCELPLGLTCYDVNETFNHIVNIIDLNFLNQEFRAIDGFHMKRIATTTSESVSADMTPNGYDQRAQEQNTMQKLQNFLR